MAFSALEALQAFGAGRQTAVQDRAQTRLEQDQQRSDTERAGLSKAYDVNTGNFDPARARAAYATAGDIPGALAFDQHMTQVHGEQFTQNRARFIAGAQFLADVHDEAGFQQAISQAHQAGVDLTGVPAHYDPQWVHSIVTIGTHLQAADHYQPPPAVQLELQSAGIMPGTPEYRAAITNHLQPPRIMMVDGVPTQVDGAGGAPPAATQDLPHVATEADIHRLGLRPGGQFIGPDNQVHTIPGGPTPQASGGF